MATAAERLPRRLPAIRSRLAPPPPRTPAFVVVAITVAVLCVVGLVMILSASAVAALRQYGSSWYFFQRQLLWTATGAVVFVVTARVDYHRWRRLTLALLIVATLALLAVLVPNVGIKVDGARRWLGLGALRFQPSEVAKLALLVFAADVLSRRQGNLSEFRRGAAPVVWVFVSFAVLVLAEPDLDSTIVLALIAFSALVVAATPIRQIAALGSVGVVGVGILSIAQPYRLRRVMAFFDPWSDASNTGYQITQSIMALGSGGIDGVGLGAGRAKWAYLPNAHTDFIFAIIGEELGLIGCLVIVALFVSFGCVGYRIAARAPDPFGMLLATGVTTWVVGQATINLGAVIGLLPVSGIPLPFLSAGGSALVFTMAGAGILANVARLTPPAKPARTSR